MVFVYVMDWVPIGQGHLNVSVQTQLNFLVIVDDNPGPSDDSASVNKTFAVVDVQLFPASTVALLVYPS